MLILESDLKIPMIVTVLVLDMGIFVYSCPNGL